MPNRKTIHWAADGSLEVLTFDLGGETFAIEAVLVQEILDPLPETRVPGAHPCVPAVINFRGRVIPLADMRVAFDMENAGAGQDARIIVLELVIGGEPMQIGIGTERVNEVTTLMAKDTEPPPALGMRWPRGLLRAIVRRADAVVLLPDLVSLFEPLTGSAAETAAFA